MKNSDYSIENRHKSDEPPHSRLFIICGKNVVKNELEEAFDKFGTIEETWIVMDKNSGDPKGVAYIKFSKTSEAALAMESMNGRVLNNHTRPLKVMIASSREQGSKRDDNDERFLRLFIVVPKKDSENDIRDYFRGFGDVAHVKLVKDNSTRESKGFAYVKYHKMSHAAKAYEECDRSYRAVFAKPKESRPLVEERYSSYSQSSGGSSYQERHFGFCGNHQSSNKPGDVINNFPNHEGYTKVTVVIPTHFPQNHFAHLFSIIPGMERTSVKFNSPKILSVQYSSPQSAAYAVEKLNGFEYPPGHRLVVKPELDYSSGNFNKPGSFHSMLGRISQGEELVGPSSSMSNEITTLTKALAEATQIIKAAGLLNNGRTETGAETFDAHLCSATLPPPQPVASHDTKAEERLFVVCQPGVPPMSVMWDVFGRFGDLIDVLVMNGKNYGYVLYASKESALHAIETLHGQVLCNARLKVMLADPPNNRESRKRQRVDDS